MGIDVVALADRTLIDPSGREHRLGDRWILGPSVVLFLRHFG